MPDTMRTPIRTAPHHAQHSAAHTKYKVTERDAPPFEGGREGGGVCLGEVEKPCP